MRFYLQGSFNVVYNLKDSIATGFEIFFRLYGLEFSTQSSLSLKSSIHDFYSRKNIFVIFVISSVFQALHITIDFSFRFLE